MGLLAKKTWITNEARTTLATTAKDIETALIAVKNALTSTITSLSGVVEKNKNVYTAQKREIGEMYGMSLYRHVYVTPCTITTVSNHPAISATISLGDMSTLNTLIIEWGVLQYIIDNKIYYVPISTPNINYYDVDTGVTFKACIVLNETTGNVNIEVEAYWNGTSSEVGTIVNPQTIISVLGH